MNDDKKWPKISIVTPSYNQGEFLEQTIKSVLDQNYPNLEYIIIDGGSIDNSIDIIKKYANELAYWVSEKDNGQTHAINKGFEMATGDIFGYINSDDYYLPNALQNAVNILKEENIDFVVGNTIKIPLGEVTNMNGFEFNIINQLNSFDLTPPQQSSFWRSKSHIKFNEDYHYVFDRLFFMQSIEKNKKFVVVDDIFGAFRLHISSKTVTSSIKFDQENYLANCLIIEKMKASEHLKQRLFKHQKFLFRRITFHSKSMLSLRGLISLYKILKLKPNFLFSKELAGKLKKDLRKNVSEM